MEPPVEIRHSTPGGPEFSGRQGARTGPAAAFAGYTGLGDNVGTLVWTITAIAFCIR